MRRIRLRCIPADPVAEIHESDVVEIGDGKMIVAVARSLARGAEPASLQSLAEAIEGLSGKPVLAINLSEGEKFELWEEE
jgi:hypothetical protein